MWECVSYLANLLFQHTQTPNITFLCGEMPLCKKYKPVLFNQRNIINGLLNHLTLTHSDTKYNFTLWKEI